MSEKRNGILNLRDAREAAPPVDAVEAMRRQLALAAFDSIKESDIGEMVAKLKSMAMEGNLKAMDMFLKLYTNLGKPAAAPPPSDSHGLKLMAEAVQDLVDEIRIGKAQQARQLTRLEDDDA